MSNEKLIISSKKYRGDSTVISIRLPDELVKALDKTAEETGRTRNEVIQKCLAFAVDNLEIKEY
jgi:predicted transcriptional regulator